MKNIFVFLFCLIGSMGITCGQDYQFISFNIRYDNEADGINSWEHRKVEVARYLQGVNPTIFGIQEGLNRQVDFLNNQLSDFEYIGVGRDDGLTKGEYCAVFYNINQVILVASGTFWLSDTPESVSVGWDASMERICTYGLFEDISNGKQFWLFNTHFDHKGPLAREYSAKLIVNKIKNLNLAKLPVILMGDFNATPDQPPIAVFKEFMDDGLTISKAPLIGPNGTFNGFRKETENRRIDYVFTSAFKVNSYSHEEARTEQGRYISDHLPVLVQATRENQNE